MLFDIFSFAAFSNMVLIVGFANVINTIWDLWKFPGLYTLSFLRCLLRFAILLLIMSSFVRTDREWKCPSRFFQRLTTETSRLILRLTHTKVTVIGMEKIPEKENFLLVCNHRHFMDPVVLLTQFPKRDIGFVAKQEIRKIPVVGKMIYKCGGAFLNRENDRAALQPIRKVTKELSSGQCNIGIFPEGRCGTEETLLPFRAGAFSIAKRSAKPIVVATVTNTENILRLQRTDVHVDICRVITPEEQSNLHTAQISAIAWDAMHSSLEQK